MKPHIPHLIIHGGAGRLEGRGISRAAYRDGVCRIIRSTWPVLLESGARQAVLHAVRLLEDDPIYNAGTGSKIQSDGVIRMTATIMDNVTNKMSGVVNVEGVQHPIDLAELLAEHHSPVLAGEPATAYARSHGFPVFDPTTDFRRAEFDRKQAGSTGTVGAVAIDEQFRIAAATSTGGRGYETPGRVSDSGTVAGNYVSSRAGVSCTGIGEDIVDHAAAVRIATRVDDGMSLEDAIARTIDEANACDRHFGLIAVDQTGCARAVSTDEVTTIYARFDGEELECFHPFSDDEAEM